MSGLINVLALENAPEIFGPVPLSEPGLADQVWFWPGLGALCLVITVLLLVLLSGWVRRKRTAKNPERELRVRLELLDGAKPSAALLMELASIMREALGICFSLRAEPRTVRELQAAVEAADNFGRAGSALGVLRQCEATLFSGSIPDDAAPLLAEADIALRALLPNAFSGSGKGELLR
jgi:hypothetical protein